MIKDTFKTIIINILTILLTIALYLFELRTENMFLICVVAILIILVETKNIYYAIISSLIFVLHINFFFTEPRYTFIVDDANYVVSFIIFFIVSIIVGSLTIRLQKQIEISKENENKINILYEISKTFLNPHDKHFIFRYVNNYLNKYLNRDVILVTLDNEKYGQKIDANYIQFKKEVDYSLKRNIICGNNENKFNDLPFKIFPIRSKSYRFGAILIYCNEGDLSNEEVDFINNILTHLIIVLERIRVTEEKEDSKLQVEKEKFKNSLLRSLSHDLRTPLTSIQGGSNLLIDSFSLIDDLTKLEMIQDIYTQSCDLSAFVENLLNMTRIDVDKKIINKKIEVIDDILSEVSEKVRRRLGTNTLEIKQLDQPETVNADAILLVQVFINLIDNAIKHTKNGTNIIISCKKFDKFIQFEVIDNGGGIKSDMLPKIFDDYFSLSTKKYKSRNFGLGLSICKTIVEAHGGTITSANNDIGGATFRFTIPNS